MRTIFLLVITLLISCSLTFAKVTFEKSENTEQNENELSQVGHLAFNQTERLFSALGGTSLYGRLLRKRVLNPTPQPQKARMKKHAAAAIPKPSKSPRISPTRSPKTSKPSKAPRISPTKSPKSSKPSKSPRPKRTKRPTTPKPTRAPRMSPTKSPKSSKPSKSPQISPTKSPRTSKPSKAPTTSKPTKSRKTKTPTTPKPTKLVPTLRPSMPITSRPTTSPTTPLPTKSPTTSNPTLSPTTFTPKPTKEPRKGLLLRKVDQNFLYIADPNAIVVDRTIYLFCSTDPPNANSNTRYDNMREYTLLTTNSLEFDVPWQNHGVVLRPASRFPNVPAFNRRMMFAPGAGYSDGWFYLYFPHLLDSEGKSDVGIARARDPRNPNSWELVTAFIQGLNLFDPCIMVTPDNRAFLYGNSRDPSQGATKKRILGGELQQNLNGFITDKKPFVSRVYGGFITEAVFVFWRRRTHPTTPFEITYYFIARAQKKKRDGLYYWMSNSPLGNIPQSNPGFRLTPDQFDAPAHGSVIEFNGRFYLFYHSGIENGGNRWRRSTCMDEITFANDGKINLVQFTCRYQPRA